MLSKVLVLFIIITNSIFVTAQSEFITNLQRQQSYYDSLVTVMGVDSMQGTGYTQYKRWYRYWAPKLNSNYDFDDYQTDLLNYTRNYTNNQGNGTPNWRLIGPNDTPVSGGSAKGTGQIHYIYKDPYDGTGNTIYACSPVGGLFKSLNNGDSWVNAGTDKGLPRPGVSSVVIDTKILETSIYVTTGNGEGFDNKKAWQTAIGVWRSLDNCNTWQNIGLDTIDSNNIYHMRKVIKIGNLTDSTHLLVTTTEGLYESLNANKEIPTWTKLIPGEFYDVVQDINNNNIIYASGSNSTGIYSYNLTNNTSTKIFDIDTITLPYDTMVIKEPNFRRISLNMTLADTNYLFAVISMRDYNYTVIYRYDINAQSWHRLWAPKGFNGYARKLGWTIRPKKNDAGDLQILGRNAFSMFRISNGLSNDTSTVENMITNIGVQPHADFHYLLIEDNNEIVWAATDGGISKGEFVNDTTISWESKNYGLAVATIEHIDVSSTGKLITSGQFDCASSMYEASNEVDWVVRNKGGGDGYQNIIVDDNNYFISDHNGHVLEYNSSWHNRYMGKYERKIGDTPCVIKDTVAFSHWATYFVRVLDKLYAVGNDGVKRYSNGEWEPWTDFQNQIGCAIPGTWRVAAMKKPDGVHQIYTSSRQEGDSSYHYLYKSINGGGTSTSDWVKIDNTPAEGFISSIQITTNPDSVLVSIQKQIFSVNTSNPNTPIWYNITHNLVAGSINSIEVKYPNTWLATERGVYYMENGTNTWINYTTNLPNCEVKDIKVKNRKVYVGTYGRGVWFASAPSCGNPGGTYTIDSLNNVLYNGTHRERYTNVIVPTGITYTINGTLSMGADCKIIVERGAKLIVDGGTITKACPDLWGGIDVWGTSDALQTETDQGWVTLKNATIEYSRDGISTIRGVHGINLSYTGGVIQADSTTFLNNSRSISMHRYPYEDRSIFDENNKSYFKNCTFTYDSSYYYLDDSPRQHVNLSEVRGVLFESNVFENTVSPSFAYADSRGVGLLSNNSGYFLLKHENATHGNIFEGLNYGVRSLAFNQTNRSIVVDQNEFNHNKTGAYFSAETFLSIIRNSFNVTTGTSISPDGYSGLYLDACTGYQVEENNFHSNYYPLLGDTYSRSTGLVINNSGPEDNFIYKNNFTNISNATIAQNHNRDINGNKGLQYKCNIFNDNYADIAVTWEGDPSSYNGIAASQGSKANEPTASAGNFFSRLGKSEFSDFNNEGEYVFYNLPGLSSVFLYRNLKPDYYTTATIELELNQSVSWTPEDGCPSNLTNKTIGELKSMIADNEVGRMIYVDSLNTMVDDGSTTTMNLDVATSIPPETMLLRDELLAASPYLSDTVMVSAAEKEDVLPNSIITEVLVANPQSARSENVLNTLDDRNNPPSESEMESIHANDTVIGAKEILESKMTYYASKKQQIVNNLVRLYINDTLVGVNDSIEVALSNIATQNSYYQQAFCRYNNDDSIGVLNKLADVSADFDLTDNESGMFNAYEDYFDLLLQLQAEDKLLINIDSIQKNNMFTLMQNIDGILQAYCLNVLIRTDGLVYNEPYLFPDTSSNKSVQLENTIDSFDNEPINYIKLYPNPAKDYITCEYHLPYGSTSIIAEILTVTGLQREIFRFTYLNGQKIIDLRAFQSGTYMIRLWSDGKVVQSEKFVKF